MWCLQPLSWIGSDAEVHCWTIKSVQWQYKMVQGWILFHRILIDSFPLFLWQVESKGGEVVVIGGVYCSDQRLAMLRSFRDYRLKNHWSVEPDIWEGFLTPEDNFFIVASEGLWDVINTVGAVKFVHTENNAGRAAKGLAAGALRQGSHDDISVLIMRPNDTKLVVMSFETVQSCLMKIIYQRWYEAFRILELVECFKGFPIEVHQFCSVQMHPAH